MLGGLSSYNKTYFCAKLVWSLKLKDGAFELTKDEACICIALGARCCNISLSQQFLQVQAAFPLLVGSQSPVANGFRREGGLLEHLLHATQHRVQEDLFVTHIIRILQCAIQVDHGGEQGGGGGARCR